MNSAFKTVYLSCREADDLSNREMDDLPCRETDDRSCGEADEPMYRGFEPGSIHKPEYRNFWKDVLKADEWVMNTIDKGYMIPFHSPPTQYEEPNKYH